MMENHKGFSKLTLNNPKQLNAINSEMLHEIYEALPGLNKTKAFWLEGAGEKAFSVGADVKQLYNAR
jgi:enoyl-CoA hydratase/carnithine racemase